MFIGGFLYEMSNKKASRTQNHFKDERAAISSNTIIKFKIT